MAHHLLATGLYVTPTPAGAHHAVACAEGDPVRDLLRAVLAYEITPLLSARSLQEWVGADLPTSTEVLVEAQRLGFVEGLEHPVAVPAGALEDLLPDLLEPLSSVDETLLADDQGFCVASRGFDVATATALSALSADLSRVHQRHGRGLSAWEAATSGAWALVDPGGSSHVGFWPLCIGEERFVLVVGGVPYLHRPQLTEVIWTLSVRYARHRSASVVRSALVAPTGRRGRPGRSGSAAVR